MLLFNVLMKCCFVLLFHIFVLLLNVIKCFDEMLFVFLFHILVLSFHVSSSKSCFFVVISCFRVVI